MPFSLITHTKKGRKCYSVVNTKSRRVHSKCTTKKKAQKQLRLLRAIIYNKNFVLKPRVQTRKARK